ncbi:MAG: hypothetical protein ACKOPE_02050 [Novosphingobium sp.]
MDTYRGTYLDSSGSDDWPEIEFGEEETPREPPPSPIGQDERRMQVRAYNHWASLLDNRNFPSIEDLAPDKLPDFGPYSVLLDFSAGIENPAVRYLGETIAAECGTDGKIETLADVPARSLLSRITDHYMQILANQAPIGFEAEFVNLRGRTILYRGILLPFSSNDETIDFIYGVINWKELADQATTDELLLEIDQALEVAPATESRRDDPMSEWADGPPEIQDEDDVLDLVGLSDAELPEEDEGPEPTLAAQLIAPGFTGFAMKQLDDEDEDEEPAAALDLRGMARDQGDLPPLDLDAFEALGEEPEPATVIALPETDAADMGLADWLASARELADAARGSEDRTRQALYAAIGKAYDFSLAATDAPEEFDELVTDSGLTVQDRAPMTPVVKLVFGADYDKTRLTEYATALSHAQRIGLGRGALAGYLSGAPGGLKGVVNEERRLKREEAGKPAEQRDTPREALARKLRQLDHTPLASVASDGAEFTLLLARRLPTGEVVLLGEVADDVPLLEKAARKLLG